MSYISFWGQHLTLPDLGNQILAARSSEQLRVAQGPRRGGRVWLPSPTFRDPGNQVKAPEPHSASTVWGIIKNSLFLKVCFRPNGLQIRTLRHFSQSSAFGFPFSLSDGSDRPVAGGPPGDARIMPMDRHEGSNYMTLGPKLYLFSVLSPRICFCVVNPYFLAGIAAFIEILLLAVSKHVLKRS